MPALLGLVIGLWPMRAYAERLREAYGPAKRAEPRTNVVTEIQNATETVIRGAIAKPTPGR